MNDLELLFRTPYVDPEFGFDISPDGKKVAFSWNITGRWEIYEMQIEGSNSPVCISSGTGGKFAPRYSPDGFQLTYALDLDGSENYHICVVDQVSNEIRDLTAEISHALQPNYAWSPDGKGIAILSIQDDHYRVSILPLDGGLPRWVKDFESPAWNVSWSPKGDQLAVVVEMDGTDFGIVVLSVENYDETWIDLDGNLLNAKNPAWSPDGSELAFSCNLHGFYDIGIYNLEEKKIHWVTAGSTEKNKPVWSPDGKQLAYIEWVGCDSRLVLHKLGEKPTSHAIEPGLYGLPEFMPDGDQLVFVFENPLRPPDLWNYSLHNCSFSQLTDSMPENLRDFMFVMPEEIKYPSLDGVEVPALLYLPTKNYGGRSDPGAAVVNIHGGPDWLFQFCWNPFMSYMASKGWVVLAPNYRGSTGYGREWQISSRYEMGKMDSEDIIAAGEYLIREKLADPNRVAITGRSHGGYLTMTCMTQRPDLWAVGAAGVPVLNLFSSHEEAREDLRRWNIENYGDPVENHSLWVERSPYFFLERIQAPVQFICGANDIRCPASDTIAAHRKLQDLGKSSEMILYPDAGHVFLKTENIIDSYTRILLFLEHALESLDRKKDGNLMEK